MSSDDDIPMPFVTPPLDADALADWFDSGFPQEFCLSSSFDLSFIEELCAAGFIPMAAEGPDRDLLLPKLHTERAVLDPSQIRITRTARRGSRGAELATDSAFAEVLAACVGIHGAGWLRPALVSCLLELHRTREGRRARLASFELWREGRLIAGEIGVFAGACYTSLTGFRREPGAGTVQLAATGRWLEAAGARLWDLGMPMDYKATLGAQTVPRREFLRRFREARGLGLSPPAPGRVDGRFPARGLVDRAWRGAPGARDAAAQ